MSNYELVAGLETHVELATKTKIFCSCTTEFGGEPNTHCCPVCIGLPGSLPKLNKKVVEYAIMAGLATHCDIAEVSKMDRKNYVYPDLSKAYQISQYDMPLCTNGYIQLSNGRKVRITRIHIEEDAGKLVHSRGNTYVDYNRGGVPLIEIVSEPDIRSPEEAKEYVEKMQFLMRYIGVSDCKMEEGSMRCDVNISVRPQGSSQLGTRTEIKNMNSISFITKAMAYEYDRQCDLLDSGEKVVQETRRYNEADECTESMRGKEDAQDYRYFPEPDLPTIHVSHKSVERLRKSLPEDPWERAERWENQYGISDTDSQQLMRYRSVADYFDKAAAGLENGKAAASCILGQMFRRMETEADKEAFAVTVPPENLNALLKLLDAGKLRMNLVKSTLEKMLDTGKPLSAFLTEKDLAGIDDKQLDALCHEALQENPKAAEDYRAGKEKAVKSLVGYVMKSTRGRADAQKTEALLKQLIAAEA
ncbi:MULTISPECIES: Asp-tRNA(Asn)/Glu-tRNA(Gln) amidotransferase subunit GatB [Caproicibacterium]|jgi:aspartyl-tRNA(Asn)/glutamyl-tRNA(Gln) amidotransferase subunit B|uniref:Aspartyl/glutamyl-tRNA(Asn/Gln) amidotransferase subunit B n=1 Tax=Caproicibacterium lactatifermentans TaxID=2666138 RepID=A0ABX6PXT4_9FIRM|nr:Asp-tRNA(Asn)/Glu-tRNA(Gln) amidotransferase subunit GatB [Caproicibacterium lactatifermentans]QKO30651.1 Asp-tRNA(Asn)/Glu-tRNA(Gln) amidotransferase subunit GatB [Caproicibacterium lactatifermentans]